MSIRETFSNSMDLVVINEYDKGALTETSTVHGQFYQVACQSYLVPEIIATDLVPLNCLY